MAFPSNRILSGIQPTGNLHLGNYLGAMKNWVAMQNDYECLFCIVDLHAITVWPDLGEIAQSSREVAAGMIASGIDPEQSALFIQSHVPAHAQLAWIFNCVARLGWLNRMTQFKDKAGKNKEKASSGLMVYPNLMAADILVYKASHVPTGEDQKQHLELARDIAQKFNVDTGKDVFPLPQPVIQGPGTRVMSLRDGQRKMSKSDVSDMTRINLTDTADVIADKIKRAKTDPEALPDSAAGLAERPEAANLINIYAALVDRSVDDVVSEFSGQGFGAFKPKLADLAVSILGPIADRMTELLSDPAELDRLLARGADKANDLANPVLAEAYDAIGFSKRG
ncbi:MAG: tryptophan--tRNA ligase [Rhodospirillaceae bacterium]|jgi:tryptophanyl-tRNA synthetase|nr:tryptophan--tRNA ligase [Rhodospirillaceae bacterium]MBT5240815.1 tryptophan--tRNA ligase [Rhodospirillaceae bacterium]MBT5564715.1 tryptophan--tRNA ligase [Rhodospirillaceae bacterium]MBT6090152.1 tryptophan--tRNA ligase [Rhodospirillaceae bacterium]MBT6960036.1 tryptophan--tRNA ligase [Rhodospirillaceae bacterium]